MHSIKKLPGERLSVVFLAILAVICSMSVVANDEIDRVKKNLAAVLTENVTVESIEPSPMEGTYIVKVGGQSVFVYSAGDFIMVGDVYDAIRKVSLSNELKIQGMVQAVENIPESEMILMGEATGRYVTVFTDTDCTYCQQFHRTVPELQSRGLQVRYLMFPRAGLTSESYREAVSVWCSENQPEAMTIAKAGGIIETQTCDNPVAEQFELGRRIGVTGTPTLVLDTGKVIPGFLKPDELMAEADISVN